MSATLRAPLLAPLTVLALTLAAGAHARNIDTVAGGGTVYGDGGLATDAMLTTPQGVAFDAAGNFYIADPTALVVRRVDATSGIITTVAGNGSYGDQGDGGPATDASLASPWGIAVDPSGDLYIADMLNLRIRKVDLGTGSGTITTFAGDGGFGYSGDQGPATLARLAFAEGVAVDAAGDVYIADTQNLAVRKVTRTTGFIHTIAGGDSSGTSFGDGGPAIDAGFSTARRIAIDPEGNYYVVDVNQTVGIVRRIDAATTVIQTVAGGGSGSGESGPATDANLGEVRDVAVDDNGNLYVAGRFRVWKVDATGDISVLAGIGINGFGGDGGPAALATFGEIGGVAVGDDGAVYISDQGNARIRRVEPDECADGLDNDGDTLLDYPSDPGCASASDLSERALGSSLLPCDNGANDDTDSFIDFPDDPGCQNATSMKENPQCQNGANDDGQLGTDFDGGDSVLGTGSGDPNGPDPQCDQPWKDREAAPPPPAGGCGIGIELVLLLPLLRCAGRRRR